MFCVYDLKSYIFTQNILFLLDKKEKIFLISCLKNRVSLESYMLI